MSATPVHVWYKLASRSTISGYELASVAVPPLFLLASLIRRKPITANGFLTSTWVGGVVGAVGGVGTGWFKYQNADAATLLDTRLRITYDVSRKVGA
jgi:hypothetical protein